MKLRGPSVRAVRRIILRCMALGMIVACSPAEAATASAGAVFERDAWVVPETKIDRLISRKLEKAGLRPAPCSDSVFLRRAYMDVIGTVPSMSEVRAFLADTDPNKREKLIDRLLSRPEYADRWAMKWSDLLRVKAEFPVNLWPNAAQAYHRWIRTAVRDNMPYDRFARDLLTANGSNFRVGPVNFYRAIQNKTPEGMASAVALTFMGTRTDAWPTNRLAGMAAFFSQVGYKPTREWKEEIVFWDPDRDLTAALTNVAGVVTNAPAGAGTATSTAIAALSREVAKPILPVHTGPRVAVFPDGKKVKLSGERDPRELFADWLIQPDNPWFARALVNRVWSWLMGRGIVHEPDDLRPDNPPCNPALLAYLEKEFVASGYDVKALMRRILASRAYQSSPVPPAGDRAEAEANFAFYPLRQLDAEMIIDAINRITGTTELYTSPIPEPFTFIPENKPAIALPDGSITSPFLELFGRPARATGQEGERINRPSPSQRMYMLNSTQIQRKLADGPGLRDLLQQGRKAEDMVDDLYLTILSRYPTDDERRKALVYMRSGQGRLRENGLDLAWALINTDEFSTRH